MGHGPKCLKTSRGRPAINVTNRLNINALYMPLVDGLGAHCTLIQLKSSLYIYIYIYIYMYMYMQRLKALKIVF